MENALRAREEKRARRQRRRRLLGTRQRPRLRVFRSNRHLYAQLIDDQSGTTLASASTLPAAVGGKSRLAARTIGQQIAAAASKQEIEAVIFDRGRFKFHGLVAELAAAARASGLQF